MEEELEKQGIFGIKEVYYAAYDGKELHFLTRESLNMKAKNVTSRSDVLKNEIVI